MGGCKARLFAQNFDAVLVVIVISPGDAIFAKLHRKCLEHLKQHISRYMVCCFFQDALFLRSAVDSEGPGPGPGLVLVLGLAWSRPWAQPAPVPALGPA